MSVEVEALDVVSWDREGCTGIVGQNVGFGAQVSPFDTPAYLAGHSGHTVDTGWQRINRAFVRAQLVVEITVVSWLVHARIFVFELSFQRAVKAIFSDLREFRVVVKVGLSSAIDTEKHGRCEIGLVEARDDTGTAIVNHFKTKAFQVTFSFFVFRDEARLM